MVKSTGYNIVKTAVLISGTGSNLKSLIKFSKTNRSPISIDLIVSSNPKAKGLKYGKIFKIRKKYLILSKEIKVRANYSLLLSAMILRWFF